MHARRTSLLGLFAVGVVAAGMTLSCAPEYRPWWLGGVSGKGLFANALGATFSEVLLDARTYTDGHGVTTNTYYARDMERLRVMIDFNDDGKVDPVVCYGDTRGVIQILLSQGEDGTAEFLKLALDGGDNAWFALLDVAAGDIDGDGRLDLIGATRDGVVYLRHPPAPFETTDMREWGAEDGELELIEGTTDTLSSDEQLAIITQALGPGANLDNYVITVEQGYTNVELGDLDNDGDNDVIASRRFRMNLEPNAGANVQGMIIVAGSLQVLLNPGGALNGEGWTTATLSQHERHDFFDREGAEGVWAIDLDRDGDLDVISAAADDNNVHVAWFENPEGAGAFDPTVPWKQYRIGSLRGANALDVADLTGDGQVDVVATGPEQEQLMLFVQPEDGPKREYDWDSHAILTFRTYQPLDVKALDVDNDGVLELVIGGTEGAVRYFESPSDPTQTWVGEIAVTFDPAGDVGLLGYGDLDADGDLDLIVAVNGSDENDDRLVWIRNELIP